MNPDDMIRLRIKLLDPKAKMPTYATMGSVGLDLYALEDGVVYGDGRKLVRTGIAIAVPDGFNAEVRPRSGLALEKGITVLNSPGTIDSDYRGEIGVILFNTTLATFFYTAGDKIAQLVFTPVKQVILFPCVDLPPTKRGEGGFGSTGDQ